MPKETKKKQSITDEIADLAVERMEERLQEIEGGAASSETAETLARDEEVTRQEASSMFDLFSHCEENIVAKGDGIRYHIFRDGGLLAIREHPYSWEEVQKEFGQGYYKVQAKIISTGKFYKQQTQRVHGPVISLNDEPANDAPETIAPVNSGPSMTETLMLLEQMQSKNAEASRQNSERTMQTITTIASTLAPLLLKMFERPAVSEPRENESLKMMMEFMRENMRNNQEQIKGVMEEVKRLGTAPKAPEGPSPLELIKQLKEADKDGYNRAMQMMEMLEEKADAKAEALMEARGGNNEEDESLFKTLAKNILPIVGQVVSAQAQKAGTEAALAPPTNLRQLPVKPQAVAAPQAAQVRLSPPRGATPVPQVMAKAPQVNNQQIKKVAPTAPVIEGEKVVKKSGSVKDNILETVLPYLGSVLSKMVVGSVTKASDAASESIKLLEAKGITKSMVKEHFTLNDVMTIVKSYGLPEKVHPWFNEYYANVNQITSAVDDRTSPASAVTGT